MSRKPITDAEILEVNDVVLRHVVWLPGAGLGVGRLPPALEDLMGDLVGERKPAIWDELPALHQFAGPDDADEDQLAAALEGMAGFIIQVETPKRKWFSDGSPRLNWGETWTDWFYARDVSRFREIALSFKERCVEHDGMMHPRIDANYSVASE